MCHVLNVLKYHHLYSFVLFWLSFSQVLIFSAAIILFFSITLINFRDRVRHATLYISAAFFPPIHTHTDRHVYVHVLYIDVYMWYTSVYIQQLQKYSNLFNVITPLKRLLV